VVKLELNKGANKMGLKRHGSKSDKFSAGYSQGLAVEDRYGESPIRKKLEDFSANKLMSKIPFKKNKEFSEGYELGKKDMNKAVKANKKNKKEKEPKIVDRNYLKGR